jgi:hypothetical protein
MSRSVPESRIPFSVVSIRIFARTGRVVFAGILAATALSPSWSFSREMVKRIRTPQNVEVDSLVKEAQLLVRLREKTENQ